MLQVIVGRLAWPSPRICVNFVVFGVDSGTMRSIEEQSDSSREASIAGQATAGTLLEREAELQRMGSVLDAVQRTRAEATIVLRGEAGIGKTALVEHFARLHSRACPAFTAAAKRCSRERQVIGKLSDEGVRLLLAGKRHMPRRFTSRERHQSVWDRRHLCRCCIALRSVCRRLAGAPLT